MSTETVNPPEEQSVTRLVSGILTDAQELLKQQMMLFQAEIRADFRRTMAAAGLIAVGAVLALPAIFLLEMIFVDLLHDQAGMAYWASHLIVGGVFAAISAVVIAIGVRRFRPFDQLPDQSIAAFKENVRWMTNPK